MRQEADRLELKPEDRVGGIIFDEMSIQEDLSVVHKICDTHYTGLIDITPHCNALFQKRTGIYI